MFEVDFIQERVYKEVDLSKFEVGDLYFLHDKKTNEKYLGVCGAVHESMQHICFINIFEFYPPREEQIRNIYNNKIYDYSIKELEDFEIDWVPFNILFNPQNNTFKFGGLHEFI